MLNFSVERDPSSQVERNGWPMTNDDSKLSPFASPPLLPSSSKPPAGTRCASDSLSLRFCLLFKSSSFPRFLFSRKVRDSPAVLSRKGVKKKRDNKGCIFQVRDFSAVSSLVPGRLNGFVIISGKYANLSSNQLSLPRFVVL